MKKILFFLSFMLVFPIITSAHTTVSVSTPSAGQVITEELREMTVEFAGEIENQGDLTLVNEQEEIEIDAISIEEKRISGTLPSPLENGSYTLTWKVAAKDGHLLTGQIPFTVAIPEILNDDEDAVQDEVRQATETEETNNSNQETPVNENTNLENKEKSETVEDNASLVFTISVITLVILLALGIFIILRKKR
jgi:methionine-rich copper-binding protein CopC